MKPLRTGVRIRILSIRVSPKSNHRNPEKSCLSRKMNLLRNKNIILNYSILLIQFFASIGLSSLIILLGLLLDYYFVIIIFARN